MTRKRLGNFANRVNDEESKDQRKQRVYELFTVEHKRWDEIAKILSLGDTTIDNIKRELIKEGKLTKDPDSGRIKKSQYQKTSEIFQQLEKSDFVKKYESAQKLVKKCKLRKNGEDVVDAFYVVCNTLGCSPDAFLMSSQDVVSLTTNFKDLVEDGKIKYIRPPSKPSKSGVKLSTKRYTSSIRKFLSSNLRPIPDDPILSGKKENYGLYSNVKLTDQEFFKMLKLMGEIDDGYNDEWRALFAFTHDAFPRAKTAINYTWNMQKTQKGVDDILTNFLSDRIYESKTGGTFLKWIYRKETLDLLECLPKGKRIINDMAKSITEIKLSQNLRECYYNIGKIERDREYVNTMEPEPWYFKNKPIHSLRHSGAHFAMRNTGFNVTVVSRFGWEDPAMITQVYAEMSEDELFGAGTCHYCDPPQIEAPNSDRVFCSVRHSLAYHSNGQKPRK